MKRSSVFRFNPFKLVLIAAVVCIVFAGVWIIKDQITAVMISAIPTLELASAVNDDCFACHGQPDRVLTFANGDTRPITIDLSAYSASVHGLFNCTQCHPSIDLGIHPKLSRVPASNPRDYALLYLDTCKTCHGLQYQENNDGVHHKVDETQKDVPACSDCHDPHTQSLISAAPDEMGMPEK